MEHSLTVGETPTEDENGTIQGNTSSSSSRIKVPDSDPVETFHNADLNEDGTIDMAEVCSNIEVPVISVQAGQVNFQSIGLPGGSIGSRTMERSGS